MKPVRGAKEDGAAGFFKGVGKGLIGAVARPVSGSLDLVSTTAEGIKNQTKMKEEVGLCAIVLHVFFFLRTEFIRT